MNRVCRQSVAGAVAALALLGAVAGSAADIDPGHSLVKVFVTSQEFDAYIPWQKREPRERSGYGTAVASNRVLTTESLVRNQTLVELQLPRTGERTTARVVLADPQIDLALLSVDPALIDLQPVSVLAQRALADVPGLRLVQLDETGEVQSGDATPLVSSITELPAAPYPALLTTLLTDITPNAKGAPVISDNNLAGLVVRFSGQRSIDVLPGDILTTFLADAAGEAYSGFAMAGFRWDDLVDPATRAYLGVEDPGGVIVRSVLLGTGADGVLQANDVILEWDGYPLDNLGFYDDPDMGRISFTYLIKFRRRPGDTVPVTVVRNGARTDLSVSLSPFSESGALIPENTLGEQPAYVVEGGLILRELTGRYLTARGGDWMRNTNPRLGQLYQTARHAPEQPGDRVVIVAGVLPDRVNVDYDRFRNEIVTHVNGQAIRNLRDVFRVLEADGHAVTIGMRAVGIDIAFDAGELPEANARLAARYRIPALRRCGDVEE